MKWVLQLQRRRKFLLGAEQDGHSPRPKVPVQPSLRAHWDTPPSTHTSPGPVRQPSRRLGCLWQGSSSHKRKPCRLWPHCIWLKGRAWLRASTPCPYLPPVNTPAPLFWSCRGRESSWPPSSGMWFLSDSKSRTQGFGKNNVPYKDLTGSFYSDVAPGPQDRGCGSRLHSRGLRLPLS